MEQMMEQVIASLSASKLLSIPTVRAMDDYIPRVYHGPVVYWKTESRSLSSVWRQLFPEIRIESARGDHFSMLRDPSCFHLSIQYEKVSGWALRRR